MVPHGAALEPAVGTPGARPENSGRGSVEGLTAGSKRRRGRAARAEKRERREHAGGGQPAENARPSTDADPRQGT